MSITVCICISNNIISNKETNKFVALLTFAAAIISALAT